MTTITDPDGLTTDLRATAGPLLMCTTFYDNAAVILFCSDPSFAHTPALGGVRATGEAERLDIVHAYGNPPLLLPYPWEHFYHTLAMSDS